MYFNELPFDKRNISHVHRHYFLNMSYAADSIIMIRAAKKFPVESSTGLLVVMIKLSHVFR